MKRHVLYRHSDVKPFKCKKCSYACVELSHMRRHMAKLVIESPSALFFPTLIGAIVVN